VPTSSARLLRLAPRPGNDGAPRRSSPDLDAAGLVALAQKKDPRAATLIWDEYAGLVRGVLCRSVGPGADIDDLLQDVFIGFFRNVGSLRDPSALKSFLIGIALRTAKTALRKRRVRRWLHLTDDGVVPEGVASTDDPHTKLAMRRLYAILDELDDRDRLSFVLRYAEGYELTEVAQALGCSLATAKRCIARADEHVLARAKDDEHLSPFLAAERLGMGIGSEGGGAT
jgi:RNA polymerase sigma-70 factor (ECF subfamily)